MKLTADNVKKTARYCYLKPRTEARSIEVVEVEGLASRFLFHRGRLAERTADIVEMLGQLNENFHEAGGNGWTFLNACVDREGNRWGEHVDVELLVCLGIAIGQAEWIFPREMWYCLPGGLPYFRVKSLPENYRMVG